MLEGLFQPMHLLIIFGIALLVFGPKKLPELGKGIGEGIRGFKSAIKAEEEKPASTTTTGPDDQSVTKGWIVGLGTEILFILLLGLLVLGPKQLHTLLGHVARAKAQFEEASRGFKSQIAAELDAVHQDGETDASRKLDGEPWSILGIGTVNSLVRLTQEESVHDAGNENERIRDIFLKTIENSCFPQGDFGGNQGPVDRLHPICLQLLGR
jgi:sec-independent protein translocase protein TatA